MTDRYFVTNWCDRHGIVNPYWRLAITLVVIIPLLALELGAAYLAFRFFFWLITVT